MEKLNMKNAFFSNFKLYKDIYKAGTMISLTNEKHLLLVLRTIGYRIITMCLLSTKETSRFRMLHNFGKFLIKMTKNHGATYTVKYLKAAQMSIQKRLSGSKLRSLRSIEPDYNFPRLSKCGLPNVIKTLDRRHICSNNLKIIRLYLSIFSIYRIIKIPFNPKLNTITDNFSGSHIILSDFNRWLTINSSTILGRFLKFNKEDLTVTNILRLVKSSPLGPLSYTRLFDSYISLRNNKIIFDNILEYLKKTKSHNILTLFHNIEFLLMKFGIRGIKAFREVSGPLGKLSFKEEAAGKLRIFAMVDVITQSLFNPLHLQLFKLFKNIPNDCTHNQNQGFKYAQELSLKYNKSYGFDLSSATDRLPLSSQTAILNSLFGIGKEWSTILVERDFIISTNNYNIPLQSLKYSVGQPMGALSSWDMLNLMHHLMIQFIACQLRKSTIDSWYDQYVILGDDLVLFDKDIADYYLFFCKELGVTINLSKSIISKDRPVLEFAKRTSVNGNDVSALSFKELLTSNNFFGRLSVTNRLVEANWGKDLWKLFIIGNKRAKDKTLDRIYPLVGYLTQLFQNNKITLDQILSLITSKDHPVNFFGRNINWMKPGSITLVVKKYFKTKEIDLSVIQKRDRFEAMKNINIAKHIMINKILFIINKVESINPLINRINILDHIITSPQLEDYYAYQMEQGKSLELEKPITERWYWMDPNFKLFKEGFIQWSSFSNIFFNTKSGSYPDLRLISQGLDIDTTFDTPSRLWHMKMDLMYLNEFKQDKIKFFKTKKFLDLSLDILIKHHTEAMSVLADLEFYKYDPDLNKEKLDNPLKVLDFIKDIKNPLFKTSSEFIFFDDQYFDIDAFSGKRKGMKPEFDVSTFWKIKK